MNRRKTSPKTWDAEAGPVYESELPPWAEYLFAKATKLCSIHTTKPCQTKLDQVQLTCWIMDRTRQEEERGKNWRKIFGEGNQNHQIKELRYWNYHGTTVGLLHSSALAFTSADACDACEHCISISHQQCLTVLSPVIHVALHEFGRKEPFFICS